MRKFVCKSNKNCPKCCYACKSGVIVPGEAQYEGEDVDNYKDIPYPPLKGNSLTKIQPVHIDTTKQMIIKELDNEFDKLEILVKCPTERQVNQIEKSDALKILLEFLYSAGVLNADELAPYDIRLEFLTNIIYR